MPFDFDYLAYDAAERARYENTMKNRADEALYHLTIRDEC